MSAENVELVTRQIGDVDLALVIRDEAAWAERMDAIAPRFATDFELVVYVPGEPVRGRGLEEFRTLFTEWLEPWETYEPGIEEIVDLDERVVVLGVDRGTMRSMEQAVEGPKGLVLYTFEDREVVRIEYFFDRDQGLRAAGIRD